jgi:polygalacturonase
MRLPFAVLLALLPAVAQDTRKVNEPVIPPPCTVLRAALNRVGASIYAGDEDKLDTARIQAAIDHCPAGQAVVLQRMAYRTDAFLSGPLQLRKGVVLVVDRGAYLYASRNPRDYDRIPGACGTITTDGKRSCVAFITAENAPGSGIMGDGVIDGRGGETILGQSITWWDLAHRARAGGSQQNPRLVQITQSDNFTLYGITLLNSPMFFVAYSRGDGFTAWGVKIWAPQRARNTDGIDPINATNVTIAYCYIYTGDDHIAIKAGAGPPTTHMSILHNHFFAGMGIAIGSETDGGASNILVSDLSIDGADNGIHIKSNDTRGGLVKGVTYEDVCIRRTQRPIWFETAYGDTNTKAAGADKLPVYRDILVRNVRVEDGGRVTMQGLDADHHLGIEFDNVVFRDPKPQISTTNTDLKTGNAGNAPANACTNKFVEFPLR